jgi:hypothetical protein
MVGEPFHISKACLEPSNAKDSKNSVTSVYIEVEDEDFLLCNLKDNNLNETLDLNFNVGDKICFKTTVSLRRRARPGTLKNPGNLREIHEGINIKMSHLIPLYIGNRNCSHDRLQHY